ncbi:Rv1535 family protein [Mycobacterium sp. 050134]|uniref:Rv1535 family protein n=1 Tax=Mycobacterium sp. 050134 TaxID=3096111 RepID=UPI002EDB7081
MTAVLLDDVMVGTTSPPLTLAPAPRQAPKRARLAIDASGDPLVDGTARLLSIPLRHAYAVLWRVGLIEVR